VTISSSRAILYSLAIVLPCCFAQYNLGAQASRRPDAGVIDYALGQRYESQADYKMAERAYEKSGDAGYAKAYIAIAKLYEGGKLGDTPGPNDFSQRMYDKAAALGDPDAINRAADYGRMAVVPKEYDWEKMSKQHNSGMGVAGATRAMSAAEIAAMPVPPKIIEIPPADPPHPDPPRPTLNRSTPPHLPFRQVMDASNRLEIVEPTSPAVLAQELTIRVKLTGPGVKKLLTFQAYQGAQESGQSVIPWTPVDQGDQTGSIHRSANGDDSFTVIPYQLGRVQLRVFAVFADGGVAFKNIWIDVRPPDAGPTDIFVYAHNFARRPSDAPIELFTLGMDRPQPRVLQASAVFDGVLSPLKLDPRSVTYTVRPAGNTEVISLDQATGLITPIRAGHALVELSYDGLYEFVCVVVKETAFSRDRNGPNCSELLTLGESDHDHR
jgi:hypothetical protein